MVSLDYVVLFSDEALVPQKWRQYQRELVLYLGCFISNVARSFLSGEQTLILVGCFEGGRCINVKATKTEECPLLRSNAEEAASLVA